MKIDTDDRIGLGPREWWDGKYPCWPTYGYDGELRGYGSEAEDGETIVATSGHTREEWLELADTMATRWLAWREWIKTAP